MSDREVMQQALEALEWSNEYLETMGEKLFPESNKVQPGSTSWHVQKAIAALRARLAEPETCKPGLQVARHPLTDEEILRLWSGDVPRPVIGRNKVLSFARDIERKITGGQR